VYPCSRKSPVLEEPGTGGHRGVSWSSLLLSKLAIVKKDERRKLEEVVVGGPIYIILRSKQTAGKGSEQSEPNYF